MPAYIYMYNEHKPIKMMKITEQLKNNNEKYKTKNNDDVMILKNKIKIN